MRDEVAYENRDFVFEHICRDVGADDTEAFRLLDEGQTYADLPTRLQRCRSDVFTDKYNHPRTSHFASIRRFGPSSHEPAALKPVAR